MPSRFWFSGLTERNTLVPRGVFSLRIRQSFISELAEVVPDSASVQGTPSSIWWAMTSAFWPMNA
jgi:hypothetical protein